MNYTCANCNQEFEAGWTDEEARAEYLMNFGKDPTPEDDAVVCDDCFNKIMGPTKPNPGFSFNLDFSPFLEAFHRCCEAITEKLRPALEKALKAFEEMQRCGTCRRRIRYHRNKFPRRCHCGDTLAVQREMWAKDLAEYRSTTKSTSIRPSSTSRLSHQ